MVMQGLQVRLYAMAMILVRFPKTMTSLATVALKTDHLLSTIDCR
jgi:hypothetical protein